MCPTGLAKQVGLEMLAVETKDPNDRSERSRILLSSEEARAVLRATFSSKLALAAESPLEKLLVSSSNSPEVKAAAKAQYKERAQQMLTLAVPPPDAKSFNYGFLSNVGIAELDWTVEDLPFVRALVEAVENPNVLAHYLPSLLYCLQSLIHTGPKEFAEAVFPRFCAWSNKPPVGRNPSNIPQGPFSTVQIHDAMQEEIPTALGWLAFNLRQKLGGVVDSELANWLQRSVLSPEPGAIPIMIYAALPAATTLGDKERSDLLATCQTLLLHLWGRLHSERRVGDWLGQTLYYIASLLRKEETGLVQWNTDGGRATLEILLSKFTPLISAFSRSANPQVRASVARLINNLKAWRVLPPQLEETFQLLSKDNRARVRFEMATTGR